MKIEQDIIDNLRALGLRYLKDNWDPIIKTAEAKKESYYNFLKNIIEQEAHAKNERSRFWRIKRANIEEPQVIETYPFDKQKNLDKQKIMGIYDSRDYLEEKRNMVFIGPTGCGKSGLATSFLIHALNNGKKGYFIKFPVLMEQLFESIGDRSHKELLKLYGAYDCLIIDEIGYLNVEENQAGLFFTLMQSRHKKKTTILTTQLGFDEWEKFFKNPHLVSALLDRLTENCHIINMGKCTSIRPKGIPPKSESK